ncbi:MAG: hypothetical protein Q8Q08_06935 [Candidatus Omnitrophota bacterium]|nr:hypothetical protein [Candidatus Omnitrophota bacterium]MDZ4242834.1 hypothetical protein [Candidatus Omnitrophota bacterium]
MRETGTNRSKRIKQGEAIAMEEKYTSFHRQIVLTGWILFLLMLILQMITGCAGNTTVHKQTSRTSTTRPS